MEGENLEHHHHHKHHRHHHHHHHHHSEDVKPKGLCGCGFLQMIVGAVSGLLSFSVLGVDRSNFDQLEKDGKGDIKHALIGLDVACLVASAWFVVTGFVPCHGPCKKEKEIDWIKTKVRYMVLSILSASVFVPLVIGAAVGSAVLRGSEEGKDLAMPCMLGGCAIIQFLLSIGGAVHACFYSPWAPGNYDGMWKKYMHKYTCKWRGGEKDEKDDQESLEKKAEKEQKKLEKEKKKELKKMEKQMKKAYEKRDPENPPPYRQEPETKIDIKL